MIYRAEKSNDFTKISNEYLRDGRLSEKTRGIFTMMLTLPDDWEFSHRGLKSIFKISEYSIANSLRELQKYGYLDVKKIYPDSKNLKKIKYEYDLYENPMKMGLNTELDEESQAVVFKGLNSRAWNQGGRNQGLENRRLLITNNTNNLNKELNTNIQKSISNEIDLADFFPDEKKSSYSDQEIINKTNTSTVTDKNPAIDKDATAVLETTTLPTPLTPLPSLLDKPPKSKSRKPKTSEKWLKDCERLLDKYEFSEKILTKLKGFFEYLVELKSMYPMITLELQLNELSKFTEETQDNLINTTIANGWKTLNFAIESLQRKQSYEDKNKPSYLNLKPSAQRWNTEEERQAFLSDTEATDWY